MEEQEESAFINHRITADPNQKPMRIDKFLMEKIERVTRSKIQNAIKFGMVKVDGEEVKANYKIRPNQQINVHLTKPHDTSVIVPEKMDLDIRYEDDDIIVLHKPAGMVVHPGVGNFTGTLVNGLAHHLDGVKLDSGLFAERSGLVHRIDKGTTGLMVACKNEHALAHLAKQFFDHSVTRKYQALVWGNFDEPEGTIDEYIGRNPNNRLQMHVFRDGEGGKHAVTHYKVLEDLYYVSVVECMLETGRTHQIRVHMKHIGHTLFNDDRYGGDKVLKGTVFSKYKTFVQNTFKLIPRAALHAKTLGFDHPTTGERMLFDSELPDDFQQALDRWRKYLETRKEKM